MGARVGRWIGATLSLAVVGSGIALFAAPAHAVPLHTLTSAGCISDLEVAQRCGGADGGPNEAQGLSGAFDVAVSPDGASVYVVGTENAIVRFNRAPDGTLSAQSCIDDIGGPATCGAGNEAQGLGDASGVAVSPDGASVYVASAGDDAIVRFNRAPDGTLSAPSCISDLEGADTCGAGNETQGLFGAADVAVSPDGASVYVVSASDQAIVRFTRAADGTLSAPSCISDIDNAETCGGVDGGSNEAEGLFNATGVAVSPDGASVYVASQNDDAIVRFNRAPDGTLTPAGCISDLEGAQTCGGADGGPNEAQGLNAAAGVAVSPDGASVYVASISDDAIVRFNRAPDGTLSAPSCISDLNAAQTCGGVDGGPNEAQGLNGAFGVAVSPDGASVYIASEDDDAIVRFNRAPDGTLSAPSCISDVDAAQTCGGADGGPNEAQGLNAAFGVAVSPNGASVYVASGSDDAVVHFKREVPPVCLGSAASGPFAQPLTVPLDCSDPNGDAVTISLVGNPVSGTLGAVDQTADTVTYTPNAGFSGSDSFLFRATADSKQSAVENASVFIAPAATVTPPTTTPPVIVTTPAKLLALLAADKLSGDSGKKLKIAFATSAGGRAEIELKKGNRVLISRQLNFSGDGEHKSSLKLATKSSRGGKGKAKPLKPGNYTIVLTVTGADRQTAKDSARLRVQR